LLREGEILKKKKDLCYGCGCAGCSMCCVWNCKTEEEARKKLEEFHKEREELKKWIERNKERS